MLSALAAQAQQQGGSGTSNLQLILTGVISVVGTLAGGGLAKVGIEWFLRRSTRRKTEAEADKTGAEGSKARAEAQKLVTEGEIAQSADYRAWAERADARATAAEARAADAEKSAREAWADARSARADADECGRVAANLREEIADLRRDYSRLLDRIAECNAGPVCPIADRLTGGATSGT